jgi:hypothetical protein
MQKSEAEPAFPAQDSCHVNTARTLLYFCFRSPALKLTCRAQQVRLSSKTTAMRYSEHHSKLCFLNELFCALRDLRFGKVVQ